MPENAHAIIHYGPYEACGIVDYREDRLDGLQTVLKKDGHKVSLVHMNDWNSVEIFVNGELVYKCDIRELDYGGDGELDPRCHAALAAVKKAF